MPHIQPLRRPRPDAIWPGVCLGLVMGAVLALAGCRNTDSEVETVNPGKGGVTPGGTGGKGAASGAPVNGGAGGEGGAGEPNAGGQGAGATPPARPPCEPPVAPIDTSQGRVVGTGTPESCTEAAFAVALGAGGALRFNCGAEPFTLVLTGEKVIRTDTVIDGGGRITISGGRETRIFAIRGAANQISPALTLQNLTLEDGLAVDKDVGGAAIYRSGGRLTVINSRLLRNRAASSGATVAGGAIFATGGGPTVIVGSVLAGNSASSGGAVGAVGSELVLINSTVLDNDATGADIDGNGGNGGAISVEGAGQALTLCGTKLAKNRATAKGGGLYRAGAAGARTTIDRSTFDGNQSLPEGKPGLGGGLYLEGTAAGVTSTTISDNTATRAGGLQVAGGELALTNATIAGNKAIAGAAGGLFAGDGATGTLLNVTVARNEALDPAGIGAGILVEAASLTLTNSIVAYNRVGNGTGPISCSGKLASGGGNLQFPVARAGGGSDDPGALCADGALVEDPLLDELADNGGPTRTAAVRAGSPAIGRGNGCPSTDQRNQPRGMPCTAGAAEAD